MKILLTEKFTAHERAKQICNYQKVGSKIVRKVRKELI